MTGRGKFARRLLQGLLGLALLAACSSGGGGITQYSATGSWSGTVTEPGGVITHEAEAVIAPDGTMHLVYETSGIVPGGGSYTSRDQFVGNIYVVDNYDQSIFRHVRQFFQNTNAVFLKIAVLDASGIQGVIYEGQAKWSFSLTATPAASRPAMMESLRRTWSNADTRQFADISVAPDLTFSGNIDNLEGCTLSGKLQQTAPGWNIYSLNFAASFCTNSSKIANFTGLAMLVDAPAGAGVPYDLRLFAATAPGDSYVLDPLMYRVINQPPVSVAGPNQVTSPKDGKVAMDGRLSSDPNRDTLSYSWSGVGPGPDYLPVALSDSTSPTPNFVPATGGPHVFTLTVSDGEFSDTNQVTLGVQLINDRFTILANGTVYDNISNLFWLRDANCAGQLPAWGDETVTIASDFAAALADGQCGLSDGSVAGQWRLPTRNELVSLVDPACALDAACWNVEGRTNPVYANPTLVNTKGDAQWVEGDAFFNVPRLPDVPSVLYWTAPDLEIFDLGLNYYVNFVDGYNSSTTDTTPNYVWPVRGLLPGETPPSP